MELINHQKITELKSLFLEFNSVDELDKIYASTQSSYNELMGFGLTMFDESHEEPVLFLIHKLKNKFRNLGMDKSAGQLVLLRQSILGGKAGAHQKKEFIDKFKDICFSSFNILFEEYLD